MTEDEVDLTQIDRPAFPTEIPAWVPKDIADSVQRVLAKRALPAEYVAMVVRLTVDPRMQAVWAHLRKKRRLDGRFLQPAWAGRNPISGSTEPSECQDWGMFMLFSMVVDFADSRPRALLRREVERKQEERRDIALKLRAEMDTLAFLEELGQSPPGYAKILSDAWAVLWSLSQAEEAGDVVVERKRGDLEAHAVAVAIAETFCACSAHRTTA